MKTITDIWDKPLIAVTIILFFGLYLNTKPWIAFVFLATMVIGPPINYVMKKNKGELETDSEIDPTDPRRSEDARDHE